MTAPDLEAVHAVADAHDQRHVVLDDRASAAPSSRRISLDQRAERLGLALRDAGGRLVEAQHARVEREQAGELDDPAGAGRQVGDAAVGVAAEPEEADQLVGLGRAGALADRRAGQEQRGREEPGAPARLERDLHRLAHGELREQSGAAWKVRPRPCARTSATATSRETSSPSSSTVPVARHEAADRVHQRRLAGAVGADEPDDLVRADAAATRRRRRRRRRTALRCRRPRAPGRRPASVGSRPPQRGRAAS